MKKFNINKGVSKKLDKIISQHDKEHTVWNRRGFLQTLGLVGAGTLMLSKVPVKAANLSPLGAALSALENDRILVIIRLKGGNDGLNMVIPFYDYENYQAARQNIKITEADSFALSNEFRMPNYMNSLLPLWNEGKMKIVHGVGYPDQNLSHFSSSDIWASAGNNGDINETGYLGRYFEDLYPDYLVNPPEVPPSVQIGSLGNLMFAGNEANYAFSVANPNQLEEIAQNGVQYDVENLPECEYGDQLGFVRGVTNTTYFYADVIKQAYDSSSNEVTYDDTSLSNQFAIVGRMIKGNLGTKIYMVSLDGFDSHADELDIHQELMPDVANAIKNFYDDLAFANMGSEVLGMTISEFGRRVEENASFGTDHGTAAPVMLFGEGLNGNGFINSHPSLTDLDEDGNLNFTTDFRSIYATVLEDWLCLDPELVNAVLLNNYSRLPLGINCTSLSIDDQILSQLEHYPVYQNKEVYVHFKLNTTSTVNIELINILGQNMGIFHNENHTAGVYKIPVNPHNLKFAFGLYIYRITVNGKSYSKKIIFS